MLERVMDNIINKIHKEVVSPQMDRIPLNYIMTRNIPDSVKHFFDQEVELWLREEADKFTSNEQFDYDAPEVRVLIDKIFDILKQTATFHPNKFNQLLERAIKLQSNYLIRPHQTLTQFLFKDSFVITTMDVYDMLKFFDKYQYYKDALTDYFNLKYLREISQNQFEELIAGIDEQVFGKDTLNATLQTVKIINSFLNEGREPSDSLPTDILYKAFRDRTLDDYAKLVQEEEEEGTEEISLTELETLLRTGKTKRERTKLEEKKEEISFDKIADIEKAKPEVQVEEISVDAKVEIPEAEEVEEEVEEEYEEEAIPQSAISAADQLADVVAEKMKGDHLESLHQIIARKQQKKFIKKVFKKDENSYQQFLDFLDETPTWKQASAAIDEMFYHKGINPYSSEALEFTDLIYNRYFPKDRLVNREEIQ